MEVKRRKKLDPNANKGSLSHSIFRKKELDQHYSMYYYYHHHYHSGCKHKSLFFLSYICNYGSHDIWLSTIDKNRVCMLASQKFTYTHPLLFIAKRAWKCLNFTSPHCLKFTKKNHWNFLKLPLNCNVYFCLKSNQK